MMRKAFIRVTVCIAVLAAGCSGEKAMGGEPFSVWAAGDGVRVNPESGKYLEDRKDIHPDYPTGPYRQHNDVWDARKGLVSLDAARNEFVSFQVIVGADGPLAGATVSFDCLAGPGGAEIAGRDIALFKAWYVRVREPSTGYEKTSLGPAWYPDALLPSATGQPTRFDLPDGRNGIGPTHRNQSVWIDIYVPRERKQAPPGRYVGRVTVAAGGQERRLDVELTVWNFALPDENHCRGDIWNGSLKQMSPEEELEWYRMCHRHRFQPGVAYYRPELKIDGKEVRIDWTEYDRRVGPYLDGSAFSADRGYWGPGEGVPIEHILLPFDCSHGRKSGAWPLAEPAEGRTPEFEAVWVEAARQVKAHFDASEKMRKVRKVVFLGHLDESYNEEAYEKMIAYCKLLRRGMGEGWFDYRIDGGYPFKAMEKLHPYVTLWVCHTAGYDDGKMSHFRKLGVEPWFYGPMVYERKGNSACGSNTFTDLDLLTCRGVGWAAWKLRSGFCQWEFDAFYDDRREMKRPTKPFSPGWQEALNCRYGNGKYNGSGLLIYRGDLAGLKHPIPSIRLKAHRRGFQDYEYFWLLREAGNGAEADKMVNEVFHTVPFGNRNYTNTDIWKHDPEAWDAARRRAGEMLHTMGTRTLKAGSDDDSK